MPKFTKRELVTILAALADWEDNLEKESELWNEVVRKYDVEPLIGGDKEFNNLIKKLSALTP